MAAPAGRRALLVVAHPRATSLTARVARHARARLARDGYEVDLLDLYAEGFDPRMPAEDEPDWNDRDKTYSSGTEAYLRRVEAADSIVVVFPVWWFGLPAMVKGWIDRVWNYGFAYGTRPYRLAGKRMTWIGLAGYVEDHFTSAGWDKILTQTLAQGISAFCGIQDATVHLIYGTIPDNPEPPADGMGTSELGVFETGADGIGTSETGAEGVGAHVRRVLAEADAALTAGNRVGTPAALLLK